MEIIESSDVMLYESISIHKQIIIINLDYKSKYKLQK